jgi:hypothetical protein
MSFRPTTLNLVLICASRGDKRGQLSSSINLKRNDVCLKRKQCRSSCSNSNYISAILHVFAVAQLSSSIVTSLLQASSQIQRNEIMTQKHVHIFLRRQNIQI